MVHVRPIEIAVGLLLALGGILIPLAGGAVEARLEGMPPTPPAAHQQALLSE